MSKRTIRDFEKERKEQFETARQIIDNIEETSSKEPIMLPVCALPKTGKRENFKSTKG